VLAENLENELVGAALGGGKLRSNVYRTEDEDWREVTVSGRVKKGLVPI